MVFRGVSLIRLYQPSQQVTKQLLPLLPQLPSTSPQIASGSNIHQTSGQHLTEVSIVPPSTGVVPSGLAVPPEGTW